MSRDSLNKWTVPGHPESLEAARNGSSVGVFPARQDKALVQSSRSLQAVGETTNGSAIGTEVFELLLSGENPADEITVTIRQLSDEDRQTVLCVACAFQAELVSICSARAADFDRLLNSECRFYIDGKRTCGR
jgi:hypothetical protein